MTYEYHCTHCGLDTEIIKPSKEFEREEICVTCNIVMTRHFAPRKVHLFGTAVQDKKFQHATGKVMTDNELKTHAKRNDWIEVGTEKPEQHLTPRVTEYPTLTSEDIRSIKSNLTP